MSKPSTHITLPPDIALELNIRKQSGEEINVSEIATNALRHYLYGPEKNQEHHLLKQLEDNKERKRIADCAISAINAALKQLRKKGEKKRKSKEVVKIIGGD